METATGVLTGLRLRGSDLPNILVGEKRWAWGDLDETDGLLSSATVSFFIPFSLLAVIL